MQSRTSEDTTNRIVAALRVVFVGIRILNLSLKSAPQKNDLTRVCLRSHNSAKKQRNRRFSWSYTIWDMSRVKWRKWKNPSEIKSHNLIGNQGTREPRKLKLFFSSEFRWKNPRKWGLRSLFSRVLSQQQNGELKKLLESPVPWFPGSLASMLHTRNLLR